jgi:hypothetical protein
MHQSLSFIARRSNTAQTYFGHPHTHHQELINCSNRLWFTIGNVVVAVLLVVVGPTGPTTTNSTAITTFPTVNQRRLLQLISS